MTKERTFSIIKPDATRRNLIGKIKDVKILTVNQNTLFGEIISNLNQSNYAA